MESHLMKSPASPIGIYALSLGAFAIGTTEFVPMGLLPQIASDLQVGIPTAGFLITVYALGVAIGAPILTVALNRLDRKTALMLLLAFFIAGNALAGVAQTYGVLLIARVLAALCHGSFFGIGALVAAALVPKERSASAIAAMFVGLTLATVLGVPFGAFIGSKFGWHVPFLLISFLGVFALGGIGFLVPRVASQPANIAAELRSLLSRPVVLALMTTTLGFGGVFTLFAYIAPLLERVSLFSPSTVSALLVLFGLGTTAGNIVAGRYADRSLPATLMTTLAALAVVLGASTFMWQDKTLAVVAIAAIGFFGFATVTPLQLLVIRASKAAPNLASSANISAFNIGNALGAALGGGVIAFGFGLSSLGAVAALVTVLGTAVAAIALKAI
jgi:DHA1 family inner membrane transport protein